MITGGLVNVTIVDFADVNVEDVVVQLPVSVAANVCDVNAAVLIGILGVSAFITSWFTRTMYIRCVACGTLNARRRTECRSCKTDL